MPTYPMGGPTVTVDYMLKQPRLLARRLTNLASKRFIADRIFIAGTPDQVQGGAARYQRSQSIYLSRDPEKVGSRADWPRAGWSDTLREAAVEQHGLEVPIDNLSIRRNAMDQLQRALMLLGNTVVKYVDGMAMSVILNDPDILTDTASGDWATISTDIIGDIAEGQMMIRAQNEGYDPDTLVINDQQALDMLRNSAIREALPRESSNQVTSGMVSPILGLRQILVTPNIANGTFLLLDTIAGTIADEQPVAAEGYSTYQPPADASTSLKPLYVKSYEENANGWVIRGARWPTMWLAEPKAVLKVTGA